MGKRAGGILLHITSLPGSYGIGDFGPEAYKFADFLALAGQKYWQVLPLNPLAASSGNFSPYNGLSAFAGNTLLISPELLYKEGFLAKKDIQPRPVFSKTKVNYRAVVSYKKRLLDIACERFKRNRPGPEYERFCAENESWLDDYAVFAALYRHFHNRPWFEWPEKFRQYQQSALKFARTQLSEAVNREKFLQYAFHKQWRDLKNYCNERDIELIGDIPFYVAYESADVWANPGLFKLTKTNRPRFISGVPPDAFSRTGQLWNNPVYNWNAQKKTGYQWWIARIKHNLRLFDLVRLDHFRGFVAYWQVPAHHKTAAKGRWIKGPGESFFKPLFKQILSSRLIAEDLGYITPAVRKLMDKFQLAGIRVLQFAFDANPATNHHCPDNYVNNTVVYTGTHDNNTVRGWFDREADAEQKKRLFEYTGDKIPADRIHWEMIRLAMSSVSDTVILPMQDVLGLGREARMNRPATIRGNWRWRLEPGQTKKSTAKKLAKLAEIYGRS